MNHLARALQFFRPDTGRAAVACIFLVLSALAGLLKPWPLAVIVDSVLGEQPLPAALNPIATWDKAALLALLAGGILLLHTAQGAFSAVQNYISIRVGLRGLASVRTTLFARLQRLSLRFHQGSSQGDVIYRASWDSYAFQTLFQQGLFTLMQGLLSLLLMLIVMWQLNVRLTLATVAILPLLLLTMGFFGRGIRGRSLQAHQADSRLTSLLQQSMAALPVIQSYAREPDEQRRFADHAAIALEKRTEQHGWEVAYWFFVALLFGLAAAIIAGYGGSQVLRGELTVGELIVFVAYLAQLYDPLNQLSHVGATVAEAKAGVQRVFELLDAPEDIVESPRARGIVRSADARATAAVPSASATDEQAVRPLLLEGTIEFDQVSFEYEPGRPVLADISFIVPARKAAAIIGPSGAGKTTLLQLVPRFYDPTAGAVQLDGTDIRQVQLRALRRQIALVQQEPILLPGTVAENIAYARPDATPGEIERAAQAAHADEFIKRLPREYETLLGEGGARLSAGEKQRINLARAFLKDAPILLLDEPTSALDPESQELVVQSLSELLRNRTALIVAHRLSTIRRVDFILAIENGRLVESGTPEQLANRDGYYARAIGTG